MPTTPPASPGPSPSHAISIRNLQKSFGSVEVLKDISLEVQPGEVVCIIGPSGSGKSTLLRCVNLLELPTSGTILVGPDEITHPDADLDRIRRLMALHPGLPVILCGHYFDETLEPADFFDLLREEKRITALFCGHDHQFAVTPMGDSGVSMCHDGHFSYPHHATLDHPTPWGFLEAELTGAGVHVRYYSDEGAVTNEAHFPLRT